ncbi:hypothetical protein A5886_000385 [Enterococcus sp. 8G7_MSG3316]|uniref:protein-tyrosine-phosphatase n=1 Tax=Candidatus Enterococcus testudinis TaxID=1834191 RepID=A0A242A2Q4_9ENTE|nr:low molecular weight protein-tyrosine-phosphatase [Enterococcus sp. 8G7_MSG3316]OTN75315.1 hypothetical protein A5886_000385 [Enterococcus sp. 8G7_MSG3316]
MTKILFVCLGNICRSPMAEALFRAEINARGLAWQVDSAATSGWEAGNPAHAGTRQLLAQKGISSKGLISRQVQTKDFEDFDWIIGMDDQNVADLRKRAPKDHQDKIHTYLSVVPDQEDAEIPDPYYTGDFEETYRLLKTGMPYWIAAIKEDK